VAKPLFDCQTTQPASLLELMPVESGGIVSKPLIDTGAIKQVLFAMDAGQDLSEHTSPFVATVHVLDGSLRFDVAGRSHEMGSGDWLVMPPNATHSLQAVTPVRMLLTLVKA
jgi:quercetin dioxygenase-like cupin family protein